MKVFVKAKPGAKEEKVEKQEVQQNLWQNKEGDLHLKVSVKEPPIEGRAKQAIIKALAKYFNTSPARITLISGASSKNKVFEVE